VAPWVEGFQRLESSFISDVLFYSPYSTDVYNHNEEVTYKLAGSKAVQVLDNQTVAAIHERWAAKFRWPANAMRRRINMVHIPVLAVVCALVTPISVFAEDRPNILWITCEDTSPNLGCYGDTFAITPTLDRLAEQGVRMTNAYGICGVCAVNRSCIITGNYSSTIGSQNMRSDIRLPRKIRCFSALLRDSGG